MKRFIIGLVLFASLSASRGDAQTLLVLPGKTVEVLGLERWSLRMIQDSLDKYAPGESLASHACAEVLRYKLGFADASSNSYSDVRDTIERVVVAVVEPQNSARVRHRTLPMDSTTPYQPWSYAIAALQHRPGAVQAAVHTYLRWYRDSANTPVPEWASADSVAIRSYWRFLAAHRTSKDYRAARALLLTSHDYRNRVVAATILANFNDRDATLHALLEATREQDGIVTAFAGSVLDAIAVDAPRTVDWRPVSASLHAILDGTSLFQLPSVMRVLVATGVRPTMARALLRRGGHMLVAYASAQHPVPKSDAHRLLVALAGRDLGQDAAVWRRWIESL